MYLTCPDPNLEMELLVVGFVKILSELTANCIPTWTDVGIAIDHHQIVYDCLFGGSLTRISDVACFITVPCSDSNSEMEIRRWKCVRVLVQTKAIHSITITINSSNRISAHLAICYSTCCLKLPGVIQQPHVGLRFLLVSSVVADYMAVTNAAAVRSSLQRVPQRWGGDSTAVRHNYHYFWQ